jgi:hypothetical protein
MNSLRRLFVASIAAAAFISTAAVAADVNVTGNWTMAVETPSGTGTPTFDLKQAGATVTGHYKGQLGEAPVTGTVKGNELSLSYKVGGQGRELTVTYVGTVEGDTIKGKVSLGELGEGTFTGKKS